MAKKAEKAKTVFVNATDILQKETNNGTSCDSAKEALTLLKNCSNSSAEACDSGELGITEDEIKNCLTKMEQFKDTIKVSAKRCHSKNNIMIPLNKVPILCASHVTHRVMGLTTRHK